MAGLAIAVLLASAQAPALRVERASDDDCAIIAEIGRARMGLGNAPADEIGFSGTYDLPGGGTYEQACDWSRYGVSPPVAITDKVRRSFYVSRPVYSDKGRRAVADVTNVIRSGQIRDGRAVAPFMTSASCELVKQRGRWGIVSCTTTMIT